MGPSGLHTEVGAPAEADRLAALRASGLLDTPPEPDFDELVELATQIMQVPFGALNLVDERRTWAKSAVGLPHGTEVPRDHAFCAEAICSPDQTMVICDTHEDDRYADNLMTQRGVRFHVSVPLQVAGGRAIGTLCVSDLRPRARPDAEQLKGLRALANAIQYLLEMRRHMARADQLTFELEELAHRDTLTGVHNRRAFDTALEHAIASAAQDGSELTIALIDLDHFKTFNDTHGHTAGDQMLRDCAAAWRGALRAQDVLARYGGEEFALILPSCAAAEALRLADRIRSLTPAGQTCSIGVAPTNGRSSATELVDRADRALYAAKAAGRDTVRLADDAAQSRY